MSKKTLKSLENESNLLLLQDPLTVVGDIHGFFFFLLIFCQFFRKQTILRPFENSGSGRQPRKHQVKN